MCRSRRELSNEYLLAKIGVDTAENKPLEVWGNYSILFNRVLIRELPAVGHRKAAFCGTEVTFVKKASRPFPKKNRFLFVAIRIKRVTIKSSVAIHVMSGLPTQREGFGM